MIRIAIVDDEREACESLERMVAQSLLSQGVQADIQTHCDAARFVEAYAPGVDLIFMDVQMPGMDGMQAASLIREKDRDVLLIFVTNMIQYAVQGYKVDAMDYIVKPVAPALLEHSLSRALRRLNERAPRHITIRSMDGLRNIDVNDIVFVEAVNHRVMLHTQAEAVACVQTLNRLEDQLRGYGFFRCHSAFLVNMKKVERIEGNDLYAAGHAIPISKHRRKDFMRELTACWGVSL